MTGVSALTGFSSSTGLLAGNAKAREAEQRFGALVDGIKAGMDARTEEGGENTAPSKSEALLDKRLPGDFITSFALTNPTDADRTASLTGAAANSGLRGSVDKTSKLYEQALELESYFVKIMLSSMRNTVQKSPLSGDTGFAGKMYEDMLYDELSRDVTRGAGFGLADQVYLQLSNQK